MISALDGTRTTQEDTTECVVVAFIGRSRCPVTQGTVGLFFSSASGSDIKKGNLAWSTEITRERSLKKGACCIRNFASGECDG